MQEDRSIAHSFTNWLIKDSNKVDVSTEEVSTAVDPHKLSEENVETEVDGKNERRDTNPEQVNRTSQTPNQTVTLDLNDPETRPVLCDKLISHLKESTCLYRGKNANFAESESEDGRRLSPDWFAKTLANGEKVERK